MRKQDIKPGVVYAYQRGRSEYADPEPVVFLNAPADGVLYQGRDRNGRPAPGAKAFTRAPEGSKPASPRAWSHSGDTGYPAVMIYRSGDEDEAGPEDLLRVTLADFERATVTTVKGISLTVMTSLTPVIGGWSEVITAHEARRKASREQAERDRSAKARRDARALAALRSLGVPARWDDYGQQVIMSLDSAEKLASLLTADPKAGER